ncbi:MAG: Multiple RNA-binding domain-containing protein 1 [Alyxoria varia]|nr:MAG: Multiple RNA-binding domain-containing protein 1 [Alyxoria varia]
MESSRIFVRDLPPSCNEQDFRKHFASKHAITDVKFFPRRRIGYVGFKSSQDALSAVQYFNKTFIRMSRIHVELARSIAEGDQNGVSSMQNTGAANYGAVCNSLKRKRSHGGTSQTDMTGSTSVPKQSPAEVSRTSETNFDDSRNASHSRLAASSEDASGDMNVALNENAVPLATENSPEIPARQAGDQHASEVMSHAEGPNQASANDTDWMRSKTSRLLGLADDDHGNVSGRSYIALDEAAAPNRVETANDGPSLNDQSTFQQAEPRMEQQIPDAEPAIGADIALSATRLFIRNLPFSVTEEDVQKLFEPIHIAFDRESGKSKGYGFAEYKSSRLAHEAREKLDGTIFQGRLVHILPASDRKNSKLDEFAISQLPLKKQKQIRQKAESNSSFNWNSLYMNTDAVMESTASRLGISKSEIMDPTSSDAAVKQAQAERHAIQETKKFFHSNGVNLESFGKHSRDSNAILVKNFRFRTNADDLKKLFSDHGDVLRVLMPPSNTLAIVEFANKVQANAAFSAIAYRKFQDSVLYLEKAPKDVFNQVPIRDPNTINEPEAQEDIENETADTATLYVRNLDFSTTNERFKQVFQALDGFLSARIMTKPDPKHEGRVLSMGFGFLEFRSPEHAKAAISAMNGHILDGHELVLKASHKNSDAAAERWKEDKAKRQKNRKAKIIIKNVPFEATKKDVRALLKPHGQLRSVRLPKKGNNSRKGFAFAEYSSPKEAEKVMEELRGTHLLGRRLDFNYAAGETEDPDKEIEKMQQKVDKQSKNVASQRLANKERKRVNIGGSGEEEAS